MFAQFLNIIVRSIKLDRSLYREAKYFGEAGIYFAGLVMILDGVAGAVAANTIIKTSIGVSGLTAIFTWFIWSILVYVIGVKLFSDKESRIPFKKVLIAVGYAHAPGILRFFAVTPEFVIHRIVWTSRHHLSFHLEDLHDKHLLAIYRNQIRSKPDNPVLDYVWAEMI